MHAHRWHLKQEEVVAEKRAKRAEVFVAPSETAAPTVEEKKKRKRSRDQKDDQEPVVKAKHKKSSKSDD